MQSVHSQWITQLSTCPQVSWQLLQGSEQPFTCYSYLNILEQTHCVGQGTGWKPMHWLLWQGSQLLAAVPGYLKLHSFGEYVFDWNWAESYQQMGLDYYPKWISAIPFTPVTGARLLLAAGVDEQIVWPYLQTALSELGEQFKLSGSHWLFTPSEQRTPQPWLRRQHLQYHWHNRNYMQFSDFLSQLTSRKRKMINKERRAVAEYGISIRCVEGRDLTESMWQCLLACYQQTYLEHSGHEGYLNAQWFTQLRQQMSKYIMVSFAEHQGQLIAASLFFVGRDTLYGRYWGSLAYAKLLHFELCYYQGIDYCITHQLAHFHAGAQGEHKLLRGFEPTYCDSFHYLSDRRFAGALASLLEQEQRQVHEQYQHALSVLPYHR
ncbi:GNAT family N-acetyltransferase [Celerinatantimonas yamalensis]|uniref:GNAT family N-acetyltransferase n=1 Tax=Celerinatantimonas yamalensis TaxID=559956 RepID=A0ABW9GBN7_9GAMM